MQRTFSLNNREKPPNLEVLYSTQWSSLLLFKTVPFLLSYSTNGYESHYLSHPEKKEKKENTHTQKKKITTVTKVDLTFTFLTLFLHFSKFTNGYENHYLSHSEKEKKSKKNKNKVDVQFPHILVWKLHTQVCEIVAGTKKEAV